ncbi:uncharacterized protein LOC113493737 [Trichoplusia ni]|uniref:Uncharacterized protein LOC113493737 n=1 Tax=Trichoplusia ni TaxID=7111 RepID=A0A7E5VGT5_TRINI|nr:uncharacterized protein LOC113493737 [Trichoplusia ni]
MVQIETYVFIDLETTGLPNLQNNETKITELSMVAVSRTALLSATRLALPRVINKFTKCLNPQRQIDQVSSKITGLTNDLLENETAFNLNVFNTINSYLELFQKPVCLIAQNGHTFDFPILKYHFELLNCALPKDILCADSLYAFYDLGKDEPAFLPISNRELASRKRPHDTVNDSSKEGTSGINHKRKFIENVQNLDNQSNAPHSVQEQNEQIPNRAANPPRRIVRSIFYENDPKPNMRFRLEDIYIRVLGVAAPEAHMAENDCTMAIQIANDYGQRFVDWVADNQMPFAEVKAMRKGAKLGF